MSKPQSQFLQFSLTIPKSDYKLQIVLLQLAIAKKKKKEKKASLELKPHSDLIPIKF